MTTPATAESIFFAALEKPDPAERAALLDAACRGDINLRRRVERLLEAHSQVGSFLQQPLADSPAAEPRTLPDPREAQAHNGGGAESGTLPGLLTPSQKPGSLGRLDHYEILGIVGQGGMGIVLKGFDEKLRRVVALKVLAPELAVHGTARQRFTREARAAAAVSHEHVVTIHAVEADHRPPYLVMQFIDGVSLQEKLDQGVPLGLKEILRIGLQTAEGLAAAHRQGLVHRDIKPANILLENGVERVKITDFGLARAVDDASMTQSGVIAGTPLFMSPEQAAGLLVDHRSDLFSLGSVLYALCTGRPPFRAEGAQAVLRRVIDDTPRPIPEVNPEIPGWLCDLIARLQAKDSAGRFQSAQDVADLLRRRLAQLQQPGQATMPGAMEKPSSTWLLRKRRWIVCAAALLLLLGLGGGLIRAYRAGWLFQSHEPSHSQDPGPWPALAKDSGDKGTPQVAPEVLEELRRLAAVQQRNFEIVQVKFDAGLLHVGDLCAARDLLIEARVKLAVAEHKPVNALLDDLVQNREEELKSAELLVEAGRGLDRDVLLAKARLDDARARLAAAGGAGEAPKAQDLIVGQWNAQRALNGKDSDEIRLIILTIHAEFTADGKFKYEYRDHDEARTVEGTYKILDENTIETTAKELEISGKKSKKTVTRKLRIESLTKTKMFLIDEKGERTDFYRVK